MAWLDFLIWTWDKYVYLYCTHRRVTDTIPAATSYFTVILQLGSALSYIIPGVYRAKSYSETDSTVFTDLKEKLIACGEGTSWGGWKETGVINLNFKNLPMSSLEYVWMFFFWKSGKGMPYKENHLVNNKRGRDQPLPIRETIHCIDSTAKGFESFSL